MIEAKWLRETLNYDQGTGIFTWKMLPPRQSHLIGKEAAKHDGGYIRIKILQRLYPAHRLAWLYMTGHYPTMDVDHIDGRRDNNSWDNLRLATRSQNSANRKLSCRNSSGFKGVTWNRNCCKWQVTIKYEGRNYYIGLFICPAEAYAAYCEAAIRIQGEFARVA